MMYVILSSQGVVHLEMKVELGSTAECEAEERNKLCYVCPSGLCSDLHED